MVDIQWTLAARGAGRVQVVPVVVLGTTRCRGRRVARSAHLRAAGPIETPAESVGVAVVTIYRWRKAIRLPVRTT
ncbi:hypothetical protein Cch01nite_43620 [Cellulomonas chitinilytica]|uniref:Uncharacterized protein n=1 Tax=Cellulomonas chitinilytica TaxID=398759 RepID=A0A919P7W4_9CELL|nr:hypothetical protein Cch01nite_43620 [Cellulomonas chitinilytica]